MITDMMLVVPLVLLVLPVIVVVCSRSKSHNRPIDKWDFPEEEK